MKLLVTHESHEVEVELHDEGDRLWLDLEGRRLEADVRRLPDGEVYSLLIGGRSYEVRVSTQPSGLEVTFQGATLPVGVRHPLEKVLQSAHRPTAGGGEETIVAPMPGVVVAIKVAPGDRVTAGQAVVVVEAMKMQNELAPRHDGVVRDVLVAERTSVSAGQPLMRLRAVDA
ncbi:MAG TPA: biotin/lipoyl-containing protein [Candidatus Limnocylindria bacterium]|nr:biotin/lipoyl-containing protein [Candidatus Limnocylindria bacterium]